MDVIEQGDLYKIIKASQIRRNENAVGDRKREDARKKYIGYFNSIFAGSASGKTSE